MKPEAISAAMYCKPKPMPTERAVKSTAIEVRLSVKATCRKMSIPIVVTTYFVIRPIVYAIPGSMWARLAMRPSN
jgi:hypothetical protein